MLTPSLGTRLLSATVFLLLVGLTSISRAAEGTQDVLVVTAGLGQNVEQLVLPQLKGQQNLLLMATDGPKLRQSNPSTGTFTSTLSTIEGDLPFIRAMDLGLAQVKEGGSAYFLLSGSVSTGSAVGLDWDTMVSNSKALNIQLHFLLGSTTDAGLQDQAVQAAKTTNGTVIFVGAWRQAKDQMGGQKLLALWKSQNWVVSSTTFPDPGEEEAAFQAGAFMTYTPNPMPASFHPKEGLFMSAKIMGSPTLKPYGPVMNNWAKAVQVFLSLK